MQYTVGQMAKRLGVVPSTLRYYDKEGLLPFVERTDGGIRLFKESDYEWLSIIECLKQSGLSIKEIRQYIDLCRQGDATIPERLELFRNRRRAVERQMAELQKTMDMLDYKLWFYQTAAEAGSTEVHKDDTVEDIRCGKRSCGPWDAASTEPQGISKRARCRCLFCNAPL